MADLDLGTLTVTVDAAVGDFESRLSSISSEMASLGDSVSSGFSGASQAAASFEKSLAGLSSAAASAAPSLRSLAAAEQQVQQFSNMALPSMEELQRSAGQLALTGDPVQEAFSKMSSSAADLDNSLKKVGLAAGAVSAAIVAGIAFSVKAIDEQQQAEMRLANATKSRSDAFDVGAIAAYAGELQKYTAYSDDASIAAATLLARFVDTGAQVTSLLPLVQDLAASADVDLASASYAVGHAIETGSLRSLTSLGIVLDESQKSLFEVSDTMGRTALVADVLGKSVGGAAGILGSTAEGEMKQLQNAVGELGEEFGKVFQGVVKSSLHEARDAMMDFTAGFSGLSADTKAMIGAITALTATFAGLLAAMVAVKLAMPLILAMVGAISAPMLAIAAAITGVGFAIAAVYKKIKEGKDAAEAEKPMALVPISDAAIAAERASQQASGFDFGGKSDLTGGLELDLNKKKKPSPFEFDFKAGLEYLTKAEEAAAEAAFALEEQGLKASAAFGVFEGKMHEAAQSGARVAFAPMEAAGKDFVEGASGMLYNLASNTFGPGGKVASAAIALGKAIDAAGGQAIGTLVGAAEDAGDLVTSAFQGFDKGGGPAGAILAVGAKLITSTAGFEKGIGIVNDAIGGLVVSLDGLVEGLVPLFEAVGSVVSIVAGSLAPVFQSLGGIFFSIGQVVKALAPLLFQLSPVFQILGDVLAVVARVVAAVAYGILAVFGVFADAWNGIVKVLLKIFKVIDKSPGVDLGGFRRSLREMKIDTDGLSDSMNGLESVIRGDMTGAVEEEGAQGLGVAAAIIDSRAAKFTDAIGKSTMGLGKSFKALGGGVSTFGDAVSEATAALSNVPSGYKVALARFNAAIGEAQMVSAPATNLSAFGTEAAAKGGNTIYATINATNPAEMWSAFKGLAQRDSYLARGTIVSAPGLYGSQKGIGK